MKKSIRFQIYSALPNFTVMSVLLLLIMGLNALNDGKGLFAAYYMGMPMVLIILALVLGSNLCMTHLHVALSLGAQRRGYFWAMQIAVRRYLNGVSGAC